MQNEDKKSLLVAGYILSFILIAAFFAFFMKKANVLLIFGILVVLQQLIVIPKFVSYWYRMKGYDIGISRFIPVYNEMQILGTVNGIIYGIANLLFIGAGVYIYLLPNISHDLSFEGYAQALARTDHLIYFMIFIYAVICFIRGIGYVGVMKEISYVNMELNGMDNGNKGGAVMLFYFLIFIPLLRSISIATYDIVLHDIVVMVGYSETDDSDEEYDGYDYEDE